MIQFQLEGMSPEVITVNRNTIGIYTNQAKAKQLIPSLSLQVNTLLAFSISFARGVCESQSTRVVVVTDVVLVCSH